MKTVTFENSFRIVLEPSERVRTCAVGIWVASGSAYETPQTVGTSHFIEHMVFKGTGRFSALEAAKRADAAGGVINAYTAKDYTCFYSHILAEHTAEMLDIICDMLTDPAFPEQDIETEKSVIMEEFSMYEDSPEDLCSDSFVKSIWNGSMLGYDVLGTRENVRGFTRDGIAEHFGKFYVPERMVASFCGKFDEDELIGICRKYFGSLPGTGSVIDPQGAQFRKCVTAIKKESLQNQLVIGFPGIRSDDPRRHTASIISRIIGSSSSSRLFQRLREQLGLVYTVESANNRQEKTGYFAVYMALSPNSEKKAIAETLKIISEFPVTVTREELDIAIEQGVSDYVRDNESIVEKAEENAIETLFYGFVETVDEVVSAIRAVTLEDVKKLSSEMLDIKKASLCAVGNVRTKQTYKKYLETV